MTQSDRDDARQREEDIRNEIDTYGPPSVRGSLPKGKKLARQKATGVSAESYDLYDIILSHLLDEGYTNTVDGALTIIENMSDDWMESILEAYKRLPVGKMMRKIESRAERVAKAKTDRNNNNPLEVRNLDKYGKALRDKRRSNKMIRVADTHSKKEAESKSKYKK